MEQLMVLILVIALVTQLARSQRLLEALMTCVIVPVGDSRALR